MNQAAQRPAAICGSTRHLQTAKGHLQAANTDNNGISADRNGDRGPEGGYKSLPGEAA